MAILGLCFAFYASSCCLSLGEWMPLNLTRVDAIYFAAGAVAMRIGVVDAVSRAPAWGLGSVIAGGYGVVTAAVAGAWGRWGLLVGPVAAFGGIAATIALAKALGRSGRMGLLRRFGVDSLAIFVAHTIASAGARIGLQKVFGMRDPAVHIAVGLLAGLFVPLWLSRASERLGFPFLFRIKLTRGPSPGAGPSRTGSTPIAAGLAGPLSAGNSWDRCSISIRRSHLG